MMGRPFYGGYGLLTVHGVAKPAFRAFELLAGAGTRRVSSIRIQDEAPGCATSPFVFEETAAATAKVATDAPVGV